MGWHQTLKQKVWDRDNFICVYCGRNMKSDYELWRNTRQDHRHLLIVHPPKNGMKIKRKHVQLSVDHVLPRSKGGDWTIENLVTCCYKCNNEKADKLLDSHPLDVARK